MSPGAIAQGPENRLPRRVADRDMFQPRHSPEGKRSRMSAVNLSLAPEEFKPGSYLEKWTHSEWKFREYKTSGSWSQTTEGLVEKYSQKSIKRGIQKFKAHPQLFIAMMYPTEMLTWPEDEQVYTLIYRSGTTGLKPKGVSLRGQVTFLMHEYQPLPSLPNDELPKKFRDQYTDKMTYRNQNLVTKKLPAYLPGRGTGLLDDPRLKVIGDIDPSDIAQGQVGDCWLLSGIASLAEFDGAIHRLFRKTENLDQMPFADGRPNMYTITLWDLPTWTEVDIVVDERLCARKDIKGALFGAKATEDGELWVCYLEKAIAAHCGGYDKIDGGQCTHAWSLLTGCKEQYIIQRIPEDPDNGPFGIWAKYDTAANRWADHGNSPSEGHQGVWRAQWPEEGGGGEEDLDEESLFLRLCAWSDRNYLIGASSKGNSDRNMTNGVVDNHAYSVIDCRNDVAGTGIDMIQVRNPWGFGSIDDGLFTRKGKGWKQHPEIKEALNYEELKEDDGVFWVTRQEFFDHYQAIYLGAMDMKEFLGILEDVKPAVNKGKPVLNMLSAPDLESDDENSENDMGAAESEEKKMDIPVKPSKADQPIVENVDEWSSSNDDSSAGEMSESEGATSKEKENDESSASESESGREDSEEESSEETEIDAASEEYNSDSDDEEEEGVNVSKQVGDSSSEEESEIDAASEKDSDSDEEKESVKVSKEEQEDDSSSEEESEIDAASEKDSDSDEEGDVSEEEQEEDSSSEEESERDGRCVDTRQRRF